MAIHPLADEFQNAPLLEPTLVSDAKALMKAKFPQMVNYFIEDTAGYIAYIEKALADNNTEALIPPAHTAKSSSKQMGALRLSLIAKAIETEAREASSLQKQPQNIAHLLTQLRQTFEQTRIAFREVA